MGGSSSKQKWQPVVLSPERTYIVTGANTGLGYEMAKHLALMGGRVILACRSETRTQSAILRMKADLLEYRSTPEPPYGYNAEDLPEEMNVEFMELDLARLASVMEFVEAFKQKGYPLHGLICNAGIGFAAQNYTEDGFESQFQVNYLGHLLLTLHLLPVMRDTEGEGRIINVSSIAHRDGEFNLDNIQGRKRYNRRLFYSNSKLYQIMSMFCLERRLKDSNITINCMHPGAVTTDIERSFKDDKFWFTLYNLGGKIGVFHSDILRGASGAINDMVNPTLVGMSGLYYDECYPVSPTPLSRKVKVQEVLWRYSMECLQDYITPEIIQDLKCDLQELGLQ